MNSAPTADTLIDVTDVEAAGRGPILLLIGFSLVWLLVSGVLALIGSIQAHSPGFLADCSVLNYGHTRALENTAFIYGWIGNAGLALALWILGRLSGEPLRALNWAVVGCFFWNAGVALGLLGIAIGGATSIQDLQMPGYVQPLLLVAYGAIGVPGVLAWTGRGRKMLFASQWYGVALIFLFPWMFSIAQVMLIWEPLHGVSHAIAAGWYSQSLWTLWLAPIGLAGIYYIVPRTTGKILPAYDMAPLGFWCLLFVGGWTGGRHLIGGPVPAWIPTIGIVTSVILLTHYIIVFLNLRGAFRLRTHSGECSPALAFAAIGLLAYVVGGFSDSVTSLRSVALTTQFTWFEEAQRQLGLYAGISMMVFGTLYFALPRLAGRPWRSAFLVRSHLILSVVGLVLLIAGLAGAGLAQGAGLNQASTSFDAIAQATHSWLCAASLGLAILLLGNLLLAVNFLRTAACCCCCCKNSAEALAT